jgi:hypothetical protein
MRIFGASQPQYLQGKRKREKEKPKQSGKILEKLSVRIMENIQKRVIVARSRPVSSTIILMYP